MDRTEKKREQQKLILYQFLQTISEQGEELSPTAYFGAMVTRIFFDSFQQ